MLTEWIHYISRSRTARVQKINGLMLRAFLGTFPRTMMFCFKWSFKYV